MKTNLIGTLFFQCREQQGIGQKTRPSADHPNDHRRRVWAARLVVLILRHPRARQEVERGQTMTDSRY